MHIQPEKDTWILLSARSIEVRDENTTWSSCSILFSVMPSVFHSWKLVS